MLKYTAHSPRSHLTVAILFMLTFCIFHCHAGFSQDKTGTVNLPISVYNVGEGLGQSSVYQVSQDSNGLIWLVSGSGLQYFDGSEFRSFYMPEEQSPGNFGNTMSGFMETVPSQMVISTVSSVINFNSATGNFKVIEHKDRQFPRIFRQFKGKPLVWLSRDGLQFVNEDCLSPITLKFQTGQNVPVDFIPNSAVTTTDGSYLLVGNNGYIKINSRRTDQETFWEAGWISFNSPCKDACNDKNGEAYFLSEGVIYSMGEKGNLKEVFNIGLKECDYLFMDRDHNFWMSDISSKKVYRIRGGTIEEIRFISWEGKNADTLNPAVRNIFEDKSGNLWFGTDGNGLLFYSPGRLVFDLSRTGFTRCISFYKDEIWAGTFKNGLWRMSVDLSRKIRVNPEILSDELYFFDLAEDGSGRLWAATNNGVFVLNGKGNVIFHYPLNTSAATFLLLPGGKLLLSAYGELFSCETGSRPGLTRLRDQTNIKEFITFEGSYWVGNQFGLFRKDTAYGVMPSLIFDEKDRLSPIPVYGILPMDGNIWVGTDNGIACYSTAGEKLALSPGIVSINHEIIYSLLPDLQNRIWFASNKGVGCIPANRDRIIRFSNNNNLQSSEFNFNANLAIPLGRIYLGGISGINGLNINDFIITDAAPEVSLISLNLSDTAYTSGIPSEAAHVGIHWGAPHVSGSVFTPDYLPAGTAQYSFLLEGYQDRWSQPSVSPMFSFRNLPPGDYRLLAKCIDSFQNQGPVKCLLTITIRPPFWKTIWFKVLATLIIISSIIIILRKSQEAKYRSMLVDLEKRNAIDRERLRISQDMHDEIGSSLTQIAILSELVKKKNNDREEIMKLVGKISNISGTVVDDLGEIIWAMNPKNDDLPIFVSYLRQHASEYLSTAGIAGNFSFPGECPQIPMTSEQRRNIFLVVKESLHNIVKHSGADTVNISLNLSGNQLSVTVEDNGTGFEPEKCSCIGNGLTGMRKRIESLCGSYSITSNPGEGTIIKFSISLAGEAEQKTTRKWD
jgi:signal transduction histidine kinase/ligand-binding sensor domain-containing protein